MIPKGSFGWVVLEFTPAIIIGGFLLNKMGWQVILILLAALWAAWWAHVEGGTEWPE